MEFLFTSISRQDDFVNVTFSGERGEKIVVTSRAPLTADLDRDGLVKKACALMKQAITHSNPKERHEAEQSPSERSQDLRQALESPAVRSYQVEKRDGVGWKTKETIPSSQEDCKRHFPPVIRSHQLLRSQPDLPHLQLSQTVSNFPNPRARRPVSVCSASRSS